MTRKRARQDGQPAGGNEKTKRDKSQSFAGFLGLGGTDEARYFQDYDPWREEYDEQAYNIRWEDMFDARQDFLESKWDIRKNQLQNSKSTINSLFQNSQQVLRQDTENALNQIRNQGNMLSSKSGFANSGVARYQASQQQENILSSFQNKQEQGFINRDSQLSDINTQIQTGDLSLDNALGQMDFEKNLAGIELERNKMGYRQDWFDEQMGTLMELFASGADIDPDIDAETNFMDYFDQKNGG